MRAAKAIGAVALILAAAGAGRARGHELKVLAGHLVAAPGEKDTIYLSWGHVLPVDGLVEAEALADYSLKTPSGSVGYLAKEGTSLQANEVKVEEAGVYTAAAVRKSSLFCVVADDQGNHTHFIGPKSAVKEGTVESAMKAHQFAKALLVSGPAAEQVPAPLGHELELVPVEAPATWRSGRDLGFRVLFRGKPVGSADVVATYLGFKPDGAWCYATATDPKGVATLRADRPGTWIVRVRTQRPGDPKARDQYDFDSYTATLTLEIRP